MARLDKKVSGGQRGFTLIELGIVIAVIAVLAATVLMGRGFVQSARVTKAVEAVDTAAKATRVLAGKFGGSFVTADSDVMTDLNTRTLLPGGPGWSPVAEFAITQIQGAGTDFVVQISCTGSNVTAAGAMCQDINEAKAQDKAFFSTGTVNGVACSALSATSVTQNLCFRL